MDRIAVEALVRLHIGEKLMILTAAQRHVGIEELIDVLPRRQEVARSEGVGMPTVIARAHAGAEKRRPLHDRHVPPAHQLQLMGGGAAGKSAADDQSRLHFQSKPFWINRIAATGGGEGTTAHELKPPLESSDFYAGAATRKPSASGI